MAWKSSVLVIANVTADSDELLEALKQRAQEGETQFTLLAPATGGGAEGRAAAQHKLESALEKMRGAGLEVEGEIGDSDPVLAVKETWDPRRFDEVIVSTLSTAASKWLRIDLPHRVERMTGVSVRHVVAPPHKPPPETQPPPKGRDHYGILEPLAGLPGGRWPPEREREGEGEGR